MATAPDTITDAPAADAQPEPDAVDMMYGDQTPADDAQPEPEQEEKPEGEEAPDEAPEPVEAPVSWAKDAKEVFGKLPPEAQQIIVEREKQREQFVQAKSREAATTRQTVEGEARQILLQLQRNHAEQLGKYAQQFEVQPPDQRLLYSGNPNDQTLYMQQDAAYRASYAQRDTAQREAQEAARQATLLEQQEQQEAIQREHAVLAEKIPEWSDPSERAKLLTTLQPIAAELGYSQEAMNSANAADILALKQAHGWKADAEKYRKLMQAKMVPVRAAKFPPPAARPGAPVGSQPTQDAAALLYPDDIRR